MDLGLKDKVAIITGGSEGIGKAAAHRMAEEGARVVIVARRPEVLKAAAEEIQKATKGTVLPVQGDVAEPATITRVVQTTLDNFGRIDILVNNAGVSMAKPFEAVSDDDWESDFSLKVWGAVRFIRAVIPEMRKVGGGRSSTSPTWVAGLLDRLPCRRPSPSGGDRDNQRPVERSGQRQHSSQYSLYRADQEWSA